MTNSGESEHNQSSPTEDEVQARGFGIYIKVINNRTDKKVVLKSRENPAANVTMNAGEVGQRVECALPWVGNQVEFNLKAVSLKIDSINTTYYLWDTSNAHGFYSTEPVFSTEADKIPGHVSGWGDYRIDIKANGDIYMERVETE